MSSSSKYDPVTGESFGIALDDMTPQELLDAAMRRRQLGWPSYPSEGELLASFDAADLKGKATMLGELWAKWRSLIER